MHISGLFIYPVKSLRGIALDQSEVGARGLRYDRNWMVVDENGHFRTQRQIARMACVSVAIGEELVFSADGRGEVATSLEPRGETIEGTVWKWTGPVDLVDPRVDQWLSDLLEMPCRLVAMRSDTRREAWDTEIAFPDGAPVLVAGEASLASLNSHLAEPVPMDRFRANVIVSGSTAYEEDEWGRFRAGSVDFEFAKRCGRCIVTTTDQTTGERHPGEEPLRTLVKERLFDKAACFGAFYLPRSKGSISVGDKLLTLDEASTLTTSSS